ncbi:hypothetical protein PTKIN_Ptkin02bG0182300 [Pterospermum kingtungense]
MASFMAIRRGRRSPTPTLTSFFSKYQPPPSSDPGGFHGQLNQSYRHPQRHRGSPGNNQFDYQGYPRGRNLNERSSQSQNPIQLSRNQKQVEVVEHKQPEPVPSLVDLTRLCSEGKVKEAIELMDKGVKADANCFSSLFELIGDPKSLESAKKIHDYFLQSTCRSDLRLNHKVIEMYVKCASMSDARRVLITCLIGIWILGI